MLCLPHLTLTEWQWFQSDRIPAEWPPTGDIMLREWRIGACQNAPSVALKRSVNGGSEDNKAGVGRGGGKMLTQGPLRGWRMLTEWWEEEGGEGGGGRGRGKRRREKNNMINER